MAAGLGAQRPRAGRDVGEDQALRGRVGPAASGVTAWPVFPGPDTKAGGGPTHPVRPEDREHPEPPGDPAHPQLPQLPRRPRLLDEASAPDEDAVSAGGCEPGPGEPPAPSPTPGPKAAGGAPHIGFTAQPPPYAPLDPKAAPALFAPFPPPVLLPPPPAALFPPAAPGAFAFPAVSAPQSWAGRLGSEGRTGARAGKGRAGAAGTGWGGGAWPHVEEEGQIPGEGSGTLGWR